MVGAQTLAMHLVTIFDQLLSQVHAAAIGFVKHRTVAQRLAAGLNDELGTAQVGFTKVQSDESLIAVLALHSLIQIVDLPHFRGTDRLQAPSSALNQLAARWSWNYWVGGRRSGHNRVEIRSRLSKSGPDPRNHTQDQPG